MHFLSWFLWIAPHLLVGVVVWIFLRRGLHKQSPVFFAYVLCELVQFVMLFALSLYGIWHPGSNLNLYRWILVWSSGVLALLSFGVIYELVNHLILSRSALGKTLRPLMRWSAALLFLLTAITSGRVAVIGVEKVMNVFQILDFSSSVLQVGLLVVLFLFSRALRISWQSLPVGIALGLGILGSTELAAAPLLAAFGSHRYALIDLIRMAGFHACVLVWLGYLIFPEQRPKFKGMPPQESDLESWNEELQKIVR
jgi:hypothetical protein